MYIVHTYLGYIVFETKSDILLNMFSPTTEQTILDLENRRILEKIYGRNTLIVLG